VQPSPGIVLTGHVLADVNGNLQQSVNSSNSGYSYLGTAQFRDSFVTVQGGSTASAPAAGGTVVSITPGTAGMWEVTGATWVTGTVAAATDSNNMALYQTGTARYSPIPLTITSTTASTAPQQFGNVVLNLSASDTVQVKAIGSATASSVYQATLIARRVG
jgi:hypothetical protein